MSVRQPPAWVTKRDGRLVPFEADKISRGLFAAGEKIGRPDAFTARELTDAILHFLAAEAESNTVSSAEIRELVAKVVRELGQPALAQAYADYLPEPSSRAAGAPGNTVDLTALEVHAGDTALELAWRASAHFMRPYALTHVFERDLVAAHAQGLLTLGGLTAPFQLAACTLPPPNGAEAGLIEQIARAHDLAGCFIVLDGPEYFLGEATAHAVGDVIRKLSFATKASGLAAVMNLHASVPPSWAGELAGGPLFGREHALVRSPPAVRVAEQLLDAFLENDARSDRLRVDWHLGASDFADDQAHRRLCRLAERLAPVPAVAVVFDRPRRPIAIAEGLDRDHPALLLPVALSLRRLLALPGATSDPQTFTQKLGSLARLALSAAVQKRDFLRRHEHGFPPFLIERSRLVVVLTGLATPVEHFFGHSQELGGPALEFAKQLVSSVRAVLRHEGESRRIETVVATTPPACFPSSEVAADNLPEAEMHGPAVPPRARMKAAGALHGASESGTLTLSLEASTLQNAGEIADLLQFAWQQTQLVRLQFRPSSTEALNPDPQPRQG